MNDDFDFLSLIPLSQSDMLLKEHGFDLVKEYFLIAGNIPLQSGPVIELATGTGRMCAVLSSAHPVIITGDISLTDQQRAVQRIPNKHRERVYFFQMDMQQLPFRSNSVDRLICMNTLHEVSRPIECLREMIRVMKPEGLLIAGDFNDTGFSVMGEIHEMVYHSKHPEGSMTHGEISGILASSFRSVRQFHTPLNNTYMASEKFIHQN